MRICILESWYEDKSETPQFPTFITPYLKGHHCETHVIHKDTAVEQVSQLVAKGFDLFINLCDGAADTLCAGIEVVQALEHFKVPFTGADSFFYEPTRQQMKTASKLRGIGTPDYVFINDMTELERAAINLSFPLIVKPPNGYGSVGIVEASRVETVAELCAQTRKMLKTYKQVLLEEFIEGREFTVLIAENPDDPTEPMAYPPIEFRFPPGESFKHYNLKWVLYDGMSTCSISDSALAEQLKAMSKALFLELKGRSYARCDIRMDRQGRLYMLEINPNCGLFYAPEDAGSADFILLNAPGGHLGFLDLIMRSALGRSMSMEVPRSAPKRSKSRQASV